MTNKRYTDEEIIKAWECCLCDNSECLQCQNKEVCKIECDELATKTLDLIIRKILENERLKAEIERYKRYYYRHEYDKWEKQIKAEAYKECIEKVRKLAVGMHPCSDELRIFDSDLDNLLKEIEGKNSDR